MAKFMTEGAEAEFRAAIEAIEKVSSVEVVITVRPRVQRWLVPHIVVGALCALATLSFELFSEDYEFDLWMFLVMPTLAAIGGGFLVELLAPLARAASGRVIGPAVATAGRAAFYELGTHNTKGRTGLLVLVAIHERRVALVGDLALIERIGEPGLDRRAAALAEHIAAGGEAFAKALAKLADDFAAVLPRAADDVNELADMVDLRGHRVRKFRGRAA